MTLATLLATFLACFSTMRSGSANATPIVRALRWTPCGQPNQLAFECANAAAPLDYADPAGPSISLRVIRHKATDAAHRIGTIFLSPRGAGDLATEGLPLRFSMLSSTMRARFDIISWDPRATGESTAVQCFSTAADEAQFFAGIAQDAFPVGLNEQLAWLVRFRAFGHLCLQRNGALLLHSSTADNARDMDLLRRAVSESRVNYLGTSYGTVLGATYANLFPDTVRAMVLDGNLSPSLYTNSGNPHAVLSTAMRFGSDQGFAESLDAFLDQCGLAGPAKCAFSTGDARSTHAKFDSLMQRLNTTPVMLDGVRITYARLIKTIHDKLVTTRPWAGFAGWIGGGALLERVAGAADAAGPAAVATATLSMADRPGRYTSRWQSLVVRCGDSPNPRPPLRFLALDHYDQAAYGPIGLVDLWADEPCSSWPVRAADQYVGPWNHPTPHPLLLLGNTHDPATPYSNSVRMSQELARSRLLTVNGYGHTALLNPSRCAQRYEDDYLVNLALPPSGTVCQQDQQPFE